LAGDIHKLALVAKNDLLAEKSGIGLQLSPWMYAVVLVVNFAPRSFLPLGHGVETCNNIAIAQLQYHESLPDPSSHPREWSETMLGTNNILK
jgi:hypothetical protein